jgi:hypothetical protein
MATKKVKKKNKRDVVMEIQSGDYGSVRTALGSRMELSN